MKTLYVALSVEMAGRSIEKHGVLSFGACIIMPRALTLQQTCDMHLAFYAELTPRSLAYSETAMRVACAHLECLETKRVEDERYDVKSSEFEPWMVLKHMQSVCESPKRALERFDKWIDDRRWSATTVVRPKICPIVDSPFFDTPHVNTWLGKHLADSPNESQGHNLKDLWRGYKKSMEASLEELGVQPPEKPHHALHDAHKLSQQARIVLFEKGLAC